MSKKFKIGDRIILTGEHIMPLPDWPVWGSKYGCIGTVTETGYSLIYVLWDNGNSKIVLPVNLSHFTGREEKSLSPNIAFKLYKRKSNEKS